MLDTANKNKVALVVGATSGIGKATAIEFAKEGYKVALAARREVEGNEIVKEIKGEGGEAIFIKTDVSIEAQVKQAIETTMKTYNRLDVAFNNAGIEGTMGKSLADLSDNDYRSNSKLGM